MALMKGLAATVIHTVTPVGRDVPPAPAAAHTTVPPHTAAPPHTSAPHKPANWGVLPVGARIGIAAAAVLGLILVGVIAYRMLHLRWCRCLSRKKAAEDLEAAQAKTAAATPKEVKSAEVSPTTDGTSTPPPRRYRPPSVTLSMSSHGHHEIASAPSAYEGHHRRRSRASVGGGGGAAGNDRTVSRRTSQQSVMSVIPPESVATACSAIGSALVRPATPSDDGDSGEGKSIADIMARRSVPPSPVLSSSIAQFGAPSPAPSRPGSRRGSVGTFSSDPGAPVSRTVSRDTGADTDTSSAAGLVIPRVAAKRDSHQRLRDARPPPSSFRSNDRNAGWNP